MNTIKSMKFSLKNQSTCQKNEPCIIEFPEESLFLFNIYFPKTPLYIRVYCDAESGCQNNRGNKSEQTEKKYHQQPVSIR